jgi:homeobox protein cut-like
MSTAEHNFSGALATWKDIKLQELQKTLDTQGIEIVDNQKESVLGRKQLADRTKEFKKIPDDEKLNSFKGLLKAYQTEIDSLTKRSKVSENAFLNVYKVLAEAPDPYPLLEAAVDQAVKATEARTGS